MPKFYVTDKVVLEVTYVYEVEAENKKEAREKFENDDGDVYVGHTLGGLVRDYDEIKVSSKPPKDMFEPLGPGRD